MLNLSEEEIKELEALIEYQRVFLGIFNKGIEVMKGLHDLETSLTKKLDDAIVQESGSR